MSGSKALLGNSLYAFKDFVASLVVLIGIRASEKPADVEHPYGHGKIEFVALLFIGVAIFIGSLFVFVHSIRDLWADWHGTASGSETHRPLGWVYIGQLFPRQKNDVRDLMRESRRKA